MEAQKEQSMFGETGWASEVSYWQWRPNQCPTNGLQRQNRISAESERCQAVVEAHAVTQRNEARNASYLLNSPMLDDTGAYTSIWLQKWLHPSTACTTTACNTITPTSAQLTSRTPISSFHTAIPKTYPKLIHRWIPQTEYGKTLRTVLIRKTSHNFGLRNACLIRAKFKTLIHGQRTFLVMEKGFKLSNSLYYWLNHV